MVIGANNDAVFARLAALMGAPSGPTPTVPYRTGPARGDAQAALDASIASWSATIGTDELLELLHDAGVPASRVFTAADIARDPHYSAREMIVLDERAQPRRRGRSRARGRSQAERHAGRRAAWCPLARRAQRRGAGPAPPGCFAPADAGS